MDGRRRRAQDVVDKCRAEVDLARSAASPVAARDPGQPGEQLDDRRIGVDGVAVRGAVADQLEQRGRTNLAELSESGDVFAQVLREAEPADPELCDQLLEALRRPAIQDAR